MPSSVANNGAVEQPEPKRRRLLDAGGPIEDDETARQKMRDAEVYERGVDGTEGEYVGFAPDNVRDVKSIDELDEDTLDNNAVTPMRYFARIGDLPMMRWLYVNGADTRDEDVGYWFPMLAAADYGAGHIEVCKWLFDHGAVKDVKRRTRWNESPLSVSFAFSSHRDLSRWLILNGALCKDNESGDLDVETAWQDLRVSRLGRYVRERKALLDWANDLHGARTSFLLFLSGALSGPKHAHSSRQTVPLLKFLGGNPGIRELIGDYVGFIRGRDARIIRQLTEMLPGFFKSIDWHLDKDEFLRKYRLASHHNSHQRRIFEEV